MINLYPLKYIYIETKINLENRIISKDFRYKYIFYNQYIYNE